MAVSFSAAEQKELISALKGSAPEADGDEALKSWIELRKQIGPEEELPEIYRERNAPFSGYDYFPNCARNAFEVATATMKDSRRGYGADDAYVREWIRGQDQVFANCSGGTPSIPGELPAGVPPLVAERSRLSNCGRVLLFTAIGRGAGAVRKDCKRRGIELAVDG
jgi:hypothetical protein